MQFHPISIMLALIKIRSNFQEQKVNLVSRPLAVE